MTVGFLFWLIFIIALVVYGVGVFRSREYDVPSLFWWVLIFLLGVGEFGWPIR